GGVAGSCPPQSCARGRACGEARGDSRRPCAQSPFLQRVHDPGARKRLDRDRGVGAAKRARRRAGVAARAAAPRARRSHRRCRDRNRHCGGYLRVRGRARGGTAMNRQTRPAEVAASLPAGTFTGNPALRIEEAVVFEIGRPEVTGVDIEAPGDFAPRIGSLERKSAIGLPGLSEPETVRHYVRLSRNNYGIDTGMFPLGSCTMKHNPRLNEKSGRLPGFSDIHPLQPLSTVPGALALLAELAEWLCELTGTAAVALSPKAGAHGELCGLMAIKAALAARGQSRSIVLVPESAHGTNPA